ncbi:DNA-binding CsgD family transcriptional regulator [Nocardia sp. GAS34]|uniref:helix-turn-helix transcriptional regulator n=1 Tax=unclassified Nocardia TaxID=2637762 RepID=UPI003D1E8BC6
MTPPPSLIAPPQALTSRDLDGVLHVLEDCERAPSAGDLRAVALEAMARYLGYRETTFFMGETLQDCFVDDTAILNGRVAGLLPQYLEHWHRYDPFARPPSVGFLARYDVASLDWFPHPSRPDMRNYLDRFLFANSMHAKIVILLRSSRAVAAMGVLDSESGAFGPRDLALARLIGRHLGGLLDLHLAADNTAAPAVALSPRQAEVAGLVADGLTNAEIAQRLHIGVDTVKKHLTLALSTTGCRNRTQLALRLRGTRS